MISGGKVQLKEKQNRRAFDYVSYKYCKHTVLYLKNDRSAHTLGAIII